MRRAEAAAKYHVVSTSHTSRRDFEVEQMWNAAHESLQEEMQSLSISHRHHSSLVEVLETRFRKWRAKYWENACREMDEQFEHSEKENEVLKKEVSQLHRHSSDLMDQIQRMELDRQAYEVERKSLDETVVYLEGELLKRQKSMIQPIGVGNVEPSLSCAQSASKSVVVPSAEADFATEEAPATIKLETLEAFSRLLRSDSLMTKKTSEISKSAELAPVILDNEQCVQQSGTEEEGNDNGMG